MMNVSPTKPLEPIFLQRPSDIGPLDIAAMIGYFIVLVLVFLFSVVKSNRSDTEGYFLADRSMNWFLIGMSLFSTNIGAEHFLGLSASGASKGISAAAFEIHAMGIMQLLSWIFLPVLVSARVKTLPEYFSVRFGGTRIRTVLTVVYLMLYLFTKVSVNLYAGGLFMQIAFNFNLYASIIGILAITALFTIAGGLTSVMYTDTVMSIVMLIGGAVLSVMSMKKVGGFRGLYDSHMNLSSVSINDTKCGVPSEETFQMLRSIGDAYIPWLGFILGHTPNTIWYWCSDQMMVQRVLAAKSLSHAKGGTLLIGCLKITPLFLMVIVGMASRVLYPQTVGCLDKEACKIACGNPRGCANIAYPTIALDILPAGLKGISLAVMISALISGLTSLFNSSSTLFTLDIYRLLRKEVSNFEVMIVGRLFAFVLIVLSIMWIPLVILASGTDIYVYIQSINSFFAAPIASVYLLSVFWHRTTEKGTFFSLIIGLLIGATRMILELTVPPPLCGEQDKRFSFVKNVNFIYFSLFSFLLTSIINIVVSMLTTPTDYGRYVKNNTFWTRLTKKEYLCVDIDRSTSSIQNQVEPEESDVEKRDSIKDKLVHAIYCICGVNKKEARDVDYRIVLAKFNEAAQSTASKRLTWTILCVLLLFQVLIFVIFSEKSLLLFKRKI
ncbi:hypothetical protein ACOME3_002769 [Neoechinorhynchus agilis]